MTAKTRAMTNTTAAVIYSLLIAAFATYAMPMIRVVLPVVG